MRFSFVLCLGLLCADARALSEADGQLLTAMVAAAASADSRLDVLSTADVRKALDSQAQKELAGCDGQKCMTEIAAALDARSVLHGTLGELGTSTVLTLSLFDTSTGVALGRSVVREADVGAVGGRVEQAVEELLQRLPSSTSRVRVLILDLDVVGAPPPPPASSPASPPTELSPLVVPGGVFAGLGGLALITAGACEVIANDAVTKLTPGGGTFAADLPGLVTQRDVAVNVGRVAWVSGGVLVVAGVGAIVVGLVGGGE